MRSGALNVKEESRFYLESSGQPLKDFDKQNMTCLGSPLYYFSHHLSQCDVLCIYFIVCYLIIWIPLEQELFVVAVH